MKIFITGGTGWFGRAMQAYLFDAGIEFTILSRSRVGALYLTGDIQTFELPEGYDYLLHMILESRGTKRLLNMAARRGVQRALFTSSGAVYGRNANRPTERQLPAAESHYAIGKLVAEGACRDSLLPVTIARCFAFVGPGMPMEHYAIGNFIRDAKKGGPIVVKGNSVRSYLYTSDLAHWLTTILLNGEGIYNVGSEYAISTPALAELVRDIVNPSSEIVIEGTDGTCYVPSTARAREELGLTETVTLAEAIKRTAESL